MKMFYRKLPYLDQQVSALCLGTAEMGTVMPKEASYQMLDAFIEYGGNFLDTAHEYGDLVCEEKSMSEKTLGNWMKSRKNRNQIIVATKGGMPSIETRHIPRLSKQEILSDLEGSLQALQVEEIDLYYLHRDDENRDVEEIIDVLEEQVKAGKIRSYGLANWRRERFERAVNYTRTRSMQEPSASQILWSLAKPNLNAIGDPTIAAMDKETWDFHFKTGIPVIPYTSQARGYFVKMKKHGEGLQDWVKKTYDSLENRSRFQRVEQTSRHLGYSVEALVLAYLTMQPFDTIPVFSSRNLEQLAASMEAGRIWLSRKWVEYLESGQHEEELVQYGKNWRETEDQQES